VKEAGSEEPMWFRIFVKIRWQFIKGLSLLLIDGQEKPRMRMFQPTVWRGVVNKPGDLILAQTHSDFWVYYPWLANRVIEFQKFKNRWCLVTFKTPRLWTYCSQNPRF
jgi:hypothetical protein